MFLTPYNRHTAVNTFDPFRALDDMERRFFGSDASLSFKTDIRDDSESYVLEADLPGVKKEDISVDLQDGYLTISAERRSEFEEKEKKGGYVRCERSYGKFSRSFDTTGVDTAAIKAGFKDGVLTLTLPKLQEVKPASTRLEIE